MNLISVPHIPETMMQEQETQEDVGRNSTENKELKIMVGLLFLVGVAFLATLFLSCYR